MTDAQHLTQLPESLARCEGPLAEKIAEHAAACEKHAADRAELERRRAGLARELADAGAGAKDIVRARNELVDAAIATHRETISLWKQRADLCRQSAARLVAQLSELESRLETTRARVAKTLGKAGLAAETDPFFLANPGAAIHRFGVQVDQAPEIRELLSRLQEIRGAAREAPKDARLAADQAAAAEQRLMKEYTRLVL